MGAVVGLALVPAGCGAGHSATSPVHPPTGARTSSIAITNFMFLPATVTVVPGATITVVNRDDVTHTVTSSTGGFDSGDIAPGATVSFTAPDRAGTYSYICSIHQYMTGTIVVT